MEFTGLTRTNTDIQILKELFTLFAMMTPCEEASAKIGQIFCSMICKIIEKYQHNEKGERLLKMGLLTKKLLKGGLLYI